MTSSFRLAKRFEEAEKYGLWQFGNSLDTYIKVHGECHPDFVAVPIGSATGPKMCIRNPRSEHPPTCSPAGKLGTSETGVLYEEKNSFTRSSWSPEMKAIAARKQMYNPYVDRYPKGWEEVKAQGLYRDEVPYDGTGTDMLTCIGRRNYPISVEVTETPWEYTRIHGPRMRYPELAQRKKDITQLPDPFFFRDPMLMKYNMNRCADSAGTFVRE